VILLLACWVIAIDARGQALGRPDLANSATTAAAPAATGEAPATVFRTGIDLVAFNVVVTDGQQKFVNGLSAADFAIYEDGVRQEVSFFAATAVPLDLAILLDTSASMTDKMRTAQTAAVGFVSTLRPVDRAMVVDIKDATKVLQPLTSDLALAHKAIESTTARGGTALYNGLYLTLKEMTKERRENPDVRRQAIVVLSDGDDTASLLAFDDVMSVAKETGIAIYTITLKSRLAVQQAMSAGHRYFSQSEYAMKSLAQETGARSFFPLDISELAGVYSTIADELDNEYALAYTSKNARRDGGYRHVIVRISDRPDVKTRTRAGYTAARPDRKVSLR